MALLKFHSREDYLVREPVSKLIKGAVAAYVGRRFDAKESAWVATEQPHAFDQASDEGQRVAQVCVRDATLWPADAETAAALGVPFTPIKLVDGAWVAAPKAETRAAKPVKE